MKFAVVALIATVSAATELIATDPKATSAAKTDDSWKWDVCLKAGDCGADWICCNASKTADGKAATGTMICTDPALSGTVPAGIKDYAGFTYFCTHD